MAYFGNGRLALGFDYNSVWPAPFVFCSRSALESGAVKVLPDSAIALLSPRQRNGLSEVAVEIDYAKIGEKDFLFELPPTSFYESGTHWIGGVLGIPSAMPSSTRLIFGELPVWYDMNEHRPGWRRGVEDPVNSAALHTLYDWWCDKADAPGKKPLERAVLHFATYCRKTAIDNFANAYFHYQAFKEDFGVFLTSQDPKFRSMRNVDSRLEKLCEQPAVIIDELIRFWGSDRSGYSSNWKLLPSHPPAACLTRERFAWLSSWVHHDLLKQYRMGVREVVLESCKLTSLLNKRHHLADKLRPALA